MNAILDGEIPRARLRRIETRTYTASSKVDWIVSVRSYPAGFTTIETIVKIDSHIEYPDRSTSDTRLYISSAPLDIERLANGIRGHWGRGKHALVLDVEFKDDLSRYRSGHGAKNMAIVRRLALGLLRANKSKRSVKTRRKSAGWNPNYLLKLLQLRFGLLMVI